MAIYSSLCNIKISVCYKQQLQNILFTGKISVTANAVSKVQFHFHEYIMKDYMLLTPLDSVDLMKWIRIDKRNNSLKTKLKKSV